MFTLNSWVRTWPIAIEMGMRSGTSILVAAHRCQPPYIAMPLIIRIMATRLFRDVATVNILEEGLAGAPCSSGFCARVHLRGHDITEARRAGPRFFGCPTLAGKGGRALFLAYECRRSLGSVTRAVQWANHNRALRGSWNAASL